MSKHTPGPWTWDRADRKGVKRYLTLDGKDGTMTVIFHEAYWLPSKADKALIAAAPDLLVALKTLYEETADYIKVNHLGDVHHNRSMREARAAIAKAEGKP